MKRLSPGEFLAWSGKPSKQGPLRFVTCYDYAFARIVNDSPVHGILVGDSAAMVCHGHKTTIPATIEMLTEHVAAVSRGAPDKFIVADLPFLSYRGDRDRTVQAVRTLIAAGANAVKIEGASGNEALVQYLVESGVPVMGHTGLTPQFVNSFGGFRTQGKDERSASYIREEALRFQEAGCFSLVLEFIPASLAEEITDSLSIPTIGIGAGEGTSGQIVVIYDLLGITRGPKSIPRLLDGSTLILKALKEYCGETESGYEHAAI